MLNFKESKMFQRLLVRTLIFFTMTVTAFMVMQPLTEVTGWPEVILCTKAAAVMAWAEITGLWIRLALAPRLDVQEAAVKADGDPKAQAIVYAVHQGMWAVRLTAFIVLYGVL